MTDITSDNETSLLLQILDDLGVGRLDMYTLVIWDLVREFTGLIQRARRELVLFDDAVGNSDTVIVLTESRGLMDNTSTRGIGNVLVGDDSESPVLVLLGEVVEHGHVAPSNHVFTLEGTNLLELGLCLRVRLLLGIVSLVNGGKEVLEKDEVLIPLKIMNLDVGEVRVDTQTQVGGKGPRCGRPSEQRSGRVIDKGERNGDWV